MNRAALVAGLSFLALSACAHPEDRRWKMRTELDAPVPANELPDVQVYSIATPTPPGKIRLTELSDHGQAALIEALAGTGVDAAALRSWVASPLSTDKAGSGLLDRASLDRTLIISVSKGFEAQPGDRLMRTIVTITPHRPNDAARPPFEFAGYTIAATDNKVQDIAHLETKSDASLTATVAPTISSTGANSLAGSLVGALSRSHTTSADIKQQYENLNVDITPQRLRITRESERGLDVVGNTIIALTLATPSYTDRPSAFLASSGKFFAKGKAVAPKAAALSIRPYRHLAACPLEADVVMQYQLRRIVRGREYYTEGKQRVAIVTNAVSRPKQILVRGEEALGELYQVMVYAGGSDGVALMASTVDGGQQRLLFSDYGEATALAAWMKGRRDTLIGADGTRLGLGDEDIPRGSTFQAEAYRQLCTAPVPMS
ncbi:MAG TPA: hypothetical protein VF548_01330 [Allosphingosinicella sp.]|jgi:hypothetical protein